ncbi:cuticular protein RR-2 motif 90 [Aphomia sociella]
MAVSMDISEAFDRKLILSIILSTSWLHIVYGAAFSQVYVQSGAEQVPVEFVKYGAPQFIANPQLAQISAAPIGSVLPLQNIVPGCVAPCIVPSQSVNTVASVPSNSKIIAYNTPNVPTVVVPKPEDKASYEYSYVVYDENTGDRKAQRELSDGSVVEGEYSLIQPDGYVREVKYRADDLTGFNAVVKNFLPESVLETDAKKPETKDKKEPIPPCKDIKKESLKEEPMLSTEIPAASKPPVEIIPVSVTAEVVTEPPTETIAIVVVDPTTAEISPVFPTEPAVESPPKPELELVENPTTEKLSDNAIEFITYLPSAVSTESASDIIKCTDETHTHDDIKAPVEEIVPKADAAIANDLVSYNDIIRCIQAAIANSDPNARANISPLTYIILPGANKPC